MTHHDDRKRGGRRPIGSEQEPAARVNVLMSGDQYDELYRAASRAGISIPEVVRRALERTRQNGDDE